MKISGDCVMCGFLLVSVVSSMRAGDGIDGLEVVCAIMPVLPKNSSLIVLLRSCIS